MKTSRIESILSNTGISDTELLDWLDNAARIYNGVPSGVPVSFTLNLLDRNITASSWREAILTLREELTPELVRRRVLS